MTDKNKIIKTLKKGGVGVLLTDTLYGLVGQALDKMAVTRIKRLKKRSRGKPFIILISSLKDLEKFGLKIDKKTEGFLKTIWPGPVSVALTPKLSFRLPKNKELVEIIKKTGPLIAPSANPEGAPPANSLTEARNYFNDKIDFYLPTRKKPNQQPSTLIKIKNNQITILREGRTKIKQTKI